MASDYCTTANLKSRLGITDSADDTVLAAKITAASRQIDGYCGRSFWQDSTVVARELYASSPTCVDLLDQPGDQPAREISTVTGLIVKTDEAGTGTYGTTLTISTDFLLMPRNAAADGRGFSEIHLADNFTFPRAGNGRPGVQVTAKFGWAATPEEVTEACLVQAAQLFRMEDAAFGIASFGDGSAMRVGGRLLNDQAKALLAPYQIVPVG